MKDCECARILFHTRSGDWRYGECASCGQGWFIRDDGKRFDWSEGYLPPPYLEPIPQAKTMNT